MPFTDLALNIEHRTFNTERRTKDGSKLEVQCSRLEVLEYTAELELGVPTRLPPDVQRHFIHLPARAGYRWHIAGHTDLALNIEHRTFNTERRTKDDSKLEVQCSRLEVLEYSAELEFNVPGRQMPNAKCPMPNARRQNKKRPSDFSKDL